MIQVKAGENTGGREAIHRLMAAYDFKSRQQLCDHLGASKSTMANRYLRDSFPAEWVIQCALETGVSLLWLTTGQGEPGSNVDTKKDINFVNSGKVKHLSDLVSPEIDKAALTNGSLVEEGKAIIDSSLLPPAPVTYFWLIPVVTHIWSIAAKHHQLTEYGWLILTE